MSTESTPYWVATQYVHMYRHSYIHYLKIKIQEVNQNFFKQQLFFCGWVFFYCFCPCLHCACLATFCFFMFFFFFCYFYKFHRQELSQPKNRETMERCIWRLHCSVLRVIFKSWKMWHSRSQWWHPAMVFASCFHSSYQQPFNQLKKCLGPPSFEDRKKHHTNAVVDHRTPASLGNRVDCWKRGLWGTSSISSFNIFLQCIDKLLHAHGTVLQGSHTWLLKGGNVVVTPSAVYFPSFSFYLKSFWQPRTAPSYLLITILFVLGRYFKVWNWLAGTSATPIWRKCGGSGYQLPPRWQLYPEPGKISSCAGCFHQYCSWCFCTYCGVCHWAVEVSSAFLMTFHKHAKIIFPYNYFYFS